MSSLSSYKAFILLTLSCLLLSCQSEVIERCQDEEKQECLPQQGPTSFRKCRAGVWQDGNCGSGKLCSQDRCQDVQTCKSTASRCLDLHNIEYCEADKPARYQNCEKGKKCQNARCVDKTEPNITPSPQVCPPLGELDEAALAKQYQRDDKHCGGCDRACATGIGEHCVKGQCTRTKCATTECHVADAEGRLFCQSCGMNCRQASTSPFGPIIQIEPQSAYDLTVENTSAEAYLVDGLWQYKVLKGCGCTPLDGSGQVCGIETDRCKAGYCSCGDSGQSCAEGTPCLSGRCEGSCDGVLACGSGALCQTRRCSCPQSNDVNMHCTQGMRCQAGQCYCEGSEQRCGGLAGDSCVNGDCVCGTAKQKCTGNSDRCIKGVCVCGASQAICGKEADRCENGRCVCGDSHSKCPAGMLCQEGRCLCSNSLKACAIGESCDASGNCSCHGGTACGPLADRCVNGSCVCGQQQVQCIDHGDRCENGQCYCGNSGRCAKQCLNGQCLCTENKHCKNGELCTNGVCTCGTGPSCPPNQICSSGQCR